MCFVISLPPSDGNNTILTIVDWFTTLVYYIPLPELHSMAETVELLVLHMVRQHEIPSNIISDHGP